MRGIVFNADNSFNILDFGEPLYETVGKAVGGPIEIVKPIGLKEPFVMIVNEEGLIRELPLNYTGSILYGALQHGSPIVGNIVIMQEGWTEDGPDIIGLDDSDIGPVLAQVADFCLQAILEEQQNRKEKQNDSKT